MNDHAELLASSGDLDDDAVIAGRLPTVDDARDERRSEFRPYLDDPE